MSSYLSAAFTRIAATWPWYIVRGAGFVAVLLIFLLMLSGIGQVTGHMYRLFEPSKAWAIHRALAIALCFSIAIHVLFLLLDHTLSFSLPQLFIPFISHYKSFWVGLGVLSMYFVAIIVASSLNWIDTKKGVWKNLHFTSYLVLVLVYFHALYTGTDLAYGAFRAIWIAIGVVMLLAVVLRLWRSGTLVKKPKS